MGYVPGRVQLVSLASGSPYKGVTPTHDGREIGRAVAQLRHSRNMYVFQ